MATVSIITLLSVPLTRETCDNTPRTSIVPVSFAIADNGFGYRLTESSSTTPVYFYRLDVFLLISIFSFISISLSQLKSNTQSRSLNSPQLASLLSRNPFSQEKGKPEEMADNPNVPAPLTPAANSFFSQLQEINHDSSHEDHCPVGLEKLPHRRKPRIAAYTALQPPDWSELYIPMGRNKQHLPAMPTRPLRTGAGCNIH